MEAYPKHIPPMAWYCKGAIARDLERFDSAQRFFHRYLRAVRADTYPSSSAQLAHARGGDGARLGHDRGHPATTRTRPPRAMARRIHPIPESVPQIRGIDGVLFLLLGKLAEKHRNLDTVADELLNQISVVGREIEGLRGEWTGMAASQFDGLMGQWNSDAQNITQLLEEVVQRLNQASTSYEEVESSITKTFGH